MQVNSNLHNKKLTVEERILLFLRDFSGYSIHKIAKDIKENDAVVRTTINNLLGRNLVTEHKPNSLIRLIYLNWDGAGRELEKEFDRINRKLKNLGGENSHNVL